MTPTSQPVYLDDIGGGRIRQFLYDAPRGAEVSTPCTLWLNAGQGWEACSVGTYENLGVRGEGAHGTGSRRAH